MTGAWSLRVVAALGLAGLELAGLGGCAAPPPPVVAVAPGAPVLTGRIVSERPVVLRVAGAEGGVLGALGAPRGADGRLAPAIEFIVREADGRIVSVIQPAPTALHPGEAVRILRGGVTRLAPLTRAAPADQA